MSSFLKHIGMVAGGLGLIAVGVFFPPVAPVLGAVGTKLVIAGGGATLLGLASPDVIKAGVAALKQPK